MSEQPAQQIPGVYHRRIGDIVVTAISDGYLDGALDVMRNINLEKAHQVLRDAFRPARRTSVNAFLIHSKGRIAIVDTGSGNYLLPTAGFVQRNLVAAGIDPKCRRRFRTLAWPSTPISLLPRPRANACSIASAPTASSSPACTCISRHSRTSRGEAMPMRFIPRPGFTRWMRPRACSGKVDTGFPSRQTRNAFARRSCSNKKIEWDDDSKKVIAL